MCILCHNFLIASEGFAYKKLADEEFQGAKEEQCRLVGILDVE